MNSMAPVMDTDVLHGSTALFSLELRPAHSEADCRAARSVRRSPMTLSAASQHVCWIQVLTDVDLYNVPKYRHAECLGLCMRNCNYGLGTWTLRLGVVFPFWGLWRVHTW